MREEFKKKMTFRNKDLDEIINSNEHKEKKKDSSSDQKNDSEDEPSEVN